MLVIDLCSGLGGFSQAFLDGGHNVIRVDNNPKFQEVPNTILEDILTMNFKPRADFKKPDILLMYRILQNRYALVSKKQNSGHEIN